MNFKVTKITGLVGMVCFLCLTNPCLSQERGYKIITLEDFETAEINWRQCEGEKITFLFTGFSEPYMIQNEQIPVFEKLTGIKVTTEEYAQAELMTKSLVDLGSRSGRYDVLMADPILVPQFAESQFVEPLDKYLVDPQLTDADWFNVEDYGFWLGAGQWKGVTYAIPFTCEVGTLDYRRDLLEKKGLSVPATFDELMEVAGKLHEPDVIAGIGLRGQRDIGLNFYVFPWVFLGFGAKFFTDFPNNLTPTLDSSDGIAALEYYVEILQKYGPAGVANWSWEEVLEGQKYGKIAMTMDAEGPLVENPEKSPTAGKWGFAVVPGGKGGRFPANFAWLFAMNRSSRHKKAAWLFLQFITSYPCYLSRGMRTGWIGRNSVLNNPATIANLKKYGNGTWIQAVIESQKFVDPNYRPVFTYAVQFGDIIAEHVQAALAGQEDPEKAMQIAQKEALELLRSLEVID